MIRVEFDGACEPRNPGGIPTYGFVIYRDRRKAHEEAGLAATPHSREATNNVAEYTGAIRALEWLVAQGTTGESVVVQGDSELVIRQLNGEYKVKSPLLAPLHKKVLELAERFPSIEYRWVPREENREADRLTARARADYLGASRRAPTTDTMSIDLVIAAPRDAVAAALRKAGLEATTEAVPGGTRVQADLPAEPDSLRPLLKLKSELEGG
jgi:ribonuclease HI